MKPVFRSIIAAGLIVGSAMTVSARTVKVMSYNVHNGVGLDRVRDHARIGSVIASERPDFVAIQEVDSVTPRSGATYVLGDIAASAGMEAVYAPAIPLEGGLYGIGLLVRERPDSVTRIPLPGREEERMLVIADYKDYAIACTHFSLTPEDALASTEIIRREAARRTDKPMILMGDLNSHPDSPVIVALREDFEILNDIDIFTFPANQPDECIDYIMISRNGSYTSVDAKVIAEPVASDHCPVVVEIDLDI